MMTAENKKVKDKKAIICFIMAIMMVLSGVFQAAPVFAAAEDAPVTDSTAIAVIDVSTGSVVYKKNETSAFNPKALTKIMTALVVADKRELSESDIARIKAMLSGNGTEEANALATEISGSSKAFVNEMNAKAKELGCKSTTFAAATGDTDAESHKTTASDMALIGKAFFENKELAGAIETAKKDEKRKEEYGTITAGDGEKTGITTAMVGVKGETTLVAIASGGASKESSLADTEAILKYGLDNYRTYIVMKKGEKAGRVKIKGGQRSFIRAYAAQDLIVTLPNEGADSLVKTETVLENKELKAPVKKDTVVGKFRAVEAGTVTAEVDLVIKDSVGTGGPWSKIGISDYMFIGICGAVIIFLILFIIVKVKVRRKKKKQAELRAKRRQEEAMRIARERAEKKRRDWPF